MQLHTQSPESFIAVQTGFAACSDSAYGIQSINGEMMRQLLEIRFLLVRQKAWHSRENSSA